MGLGVELEDVTAHYGEWAAISQLQLSVKPGEFFSLLGPSGCGKTTILRLISGFMKPSAGIVRIGGRDMAGIGPAQRPTALIFQNLALFPLMKVWENVAFGLKYRGLTASERRRRAETLLGRVSLDGQAEKLISELSGGQKQRVAIARALAVEPAVLLLDEPLSALDLKLRQHMRAELRSLQRQTGVTFIYITHDQSEALNMADRVAVMSQGRIEQVGDARNVYEEPRTPFVAKFVGEVNQFSGRVTRVEDSVAQIDTPLGEVSGVNMDHLSVGEHAVAFVRPERCRLESAPDLGINRVPCTIFRVDYDGAFVRVILDSSGGTHQVSLPNDGRLPDLTTGNRATLSFSEGAAIILRPDRQMPGADVAA
jgi:spermidine/putrescine transport system ATP-binding protein